MRITLIISSLNPGGAERILSNLANHWATKKNHQISLITFASPEVEPFYSLHKNITLIQLDQLKEEKFLLLRLWNFLKRIIALRKTISQLNSDAILSFLDITNLTTLLAASGLCVPIVATELTNPNHHILPRLYGTLRKILYPKASCVVVQTESVADYFKNEKDVVIIPNAVGKPFRTVKVHPHVTKIISLGRLCPFKGFSTLIQAFSRLVQNHSDLRLTIYGEGRDRDNLETLIQNLDLQASVSLPGRVLDIQSELLKADLFVFPSHYEGLPNALCEAMAVGLPVIASNCSGNVDVVRDGIDGRLFPVEDVEALTRLMEELLQDYPQRQKLSQEAKKLPERFSAEKIYALWDDVMEKAVKKEKSRIS